MTKVEVLSKVKKLFALSKSSNENEAALAAAKARDLLSRYNLSIADVQLEIDSSGLKVVQTEVGAGRILRNWVKNLLLHVASAFDCEHVLKRRSGLPPSMVFIGTDTDTQVAKYTFLFLYRELDRLAKEALPRLKAACASWNTSALRYAYLDGAVKRIGERLNRLAGKMKSMEKKLCKDLILAKEQFITEYMKKSFSRIKMEYPRSRMVSARAFDMGYSEAGNINLKPALDEEK